MKELTDTDVLKKVAPSMAEWPRFMRSLSAPAAWTGVSALFIAASGLFWRTVTLSTEYEKVHKDVALLDSRLAKLDQISEDVASLKTAVLGPDGVVTWKASVQQAYQEELNKDIAKKALRR